MRKNTRKWLQKSMLRTFLLAFMVILLVVIGWIRWNPEVSQQFPLTDDQWVRLEILTSVVTLAFTIGASTLILMELSQSIDSRNLNIYQDIYSKFMSDGQIESRRFIYMNIHIRLPDGKTHVGKDTPEAIEDISAIKKDKDAQEHIKHVLNIIDYFGFLVAQDWVTEEEIIDWLSPVVVKIWQKIGPIVEYERAQRPEEPDYYEAAIWLAGECLKRRDKKHPHRKLVVEFSADKL